MRKHPLITALAAVVALAATAAPANAQFVFVGGSAHHHHAVTLGAVKKATKKFQRLGVAKKAGYAILKDTQGIACIDNPGVGAMGVHYVNGTLVGDGSVDAEDAGGARLRAAARPAAAGGGRVRRVPGRLGRQPQPSRRSCSATSSCCRPAPNRFGLPAFYMLHAWIYKHNPAGKFEPWNPRVHCPAA